MKEEKEEKRDHQYIMREAGNESLDSSLRLLKQA